jgi:hypothetical protein
MLDIRMPIGGMFVVIGALLALYGLMSPAAIYVISLGHNLNLLWGAAMAAFGLVMFAWMKIDPYDSKPHPPADPLEGFPSPER